MNWRRRRIVTRWLEAEEAGRLDEADEQLGQAIRGLPRPRPPAGFADRVLLAAGFVHARPSPFSTWWFRGALLAGLALACLPILALPMGDLFVSAPSYLAPAVSLLTTVALSIGGLAHRVLVVTALVFQLGDAAQLAVRTPPALAVLFTSVATAGGALYGLRRLLVPREELVEC
jgi:hypothetical protein